MYLCDWSDWRQYITALFSRCGASEVRQVARTHLTVSLFLTSTSRSTDESTLYYIWSHQCYQPKLTRSSKTLSGCFHFMGKYLKQGQNQVIYCMWYRVLSVFLRSVLEYPLSFEAAWKTLLRLQGSLVLRFEVRSEWGWSVANGHYFLEMLKWQMITLRSTKCAMLGTNNLRIVLPIID
jgi:hypothetical protein